MRLRFRPHVLVVAAEVAGLDGALRVRVDADRLAQVVLRDLIEAKEHRPLGLRLVGYLPEVA